MVDKIINITDKGWKGIGERGTLFERILLMSVEKEK